MITAKISNTVLSPTCKFIAKGRRLERAARRSIPTRKAVKSFNRFYDRLIARRNKILFTTSFAVLR